MSIKEQAKRFAHAAHDSIGQKRKYSGEPYWVHTDAVAATVERVLPNDDEAVAAAHLHDVLEDVTPLNPDYSEGLIRIMFGERVLSLVKELTDEFTKEAYPQLNRARRKALECERVRTTSSVAQTIKLADMLNNTESITANDKDFARVYLREKHAMLPQMTKGDTELKLQVNAQAAAACVACGITV
jgi:(p)ppGpp synthase/HD superfamily hydrolase